MHGQQNDKYTEMQGQQNDKYTEMHGQQNLKKIYEIWMWAEPVQPLVLVVFKLMRNEVALMQCVV